MPWESAIESPDLLPLSQNNLPYEMDVKMEDVIHGIELDKKNLGNDLNLILLKEIGNAEIVKSNKAYFI